MKQYKVRYCVMCMDLCTGGLCSLKVRVADPHSFNLDPDPAF